LFGFGPRIWKSWRLSSVPPTHQEPADRESEVSNQFTRNSYPWKGEVRGGGDCSQVFFGESLERTVQVVQWSSSRKHHPFIKVQNTCPREDKAQDEDKFSNSDLFSKLRKNSKNFKKFKKQSRLCFSSWSDTLGEARIKLYVSW
jgi:hypothetical protein